MKRFNKFGIGTKLIALFLLVTLISGSVGFIGVGMLSDMVDKTESLFNKYGHSQGYLGFVLGEFNKQRVYLDQAAMNQNTASAKESQVQISTSDKLMMENLSKYKVTRETTEEIDSYNQLEQVIKEFRSVKG